MSELSGEPPWGSDVFFRIAEHEIAPRVMRRYRVTGARAEDLTQDFLLRLVEIPKPDSVGNVRALLYVICQRLVFDALRHKSVVGKYIGGDPDAVERSGRHDSDARAALETLKKFEQLLAHEEPRDVALLIKICLGNSYGEWREETGDTRSDDALWQIVSRLRAKLYDLDDATRERKEEEEQRKKRKRAEKARAKKERGTNTQQSSAEDTAEAEEEAR